MNIRVLQTSEQMGNEAALQAVRVLKDAIEKRGKARIVLSTGASQFDFFKAIVHADVDWRKVEMFHLDEYVDLPETHPASFRKYLRERFTSRVQLGNTFFVDGEGDIQQNIAELSAEIRREPIDLALIGIGENAHIAFNDPPADFDTEEAYIVVKLDEACKFQQVREGWFPGVEDVPERAITMTVHQILQCRVIISSVPHKEKAPAVKKTLEHDINNQIPATILKSHANWTLYLDSDSASEISGNFSGQ